MHRWKKRTAKPARWSCRSAKARNPSSSPAILHWDGKAWTAEPIEVPEESAEDFRVLALAANSPGNAWLLAQPLRTAFHAGAAMLFRRVEDSPGHWSWKPVSLQAGEEGQPLTVPVQSGPAQPFVAPGTGDPPAIRSQLLAVTEQGVWVAGGRGDVKDVEAASTALFLTPEAGAEARVQASWCQPQPGGTPQCSNTLPDALPSGFSRMIAWPSQGASEPFGRLVVTGLREGVSLRLQGSTFAQVLSLGGGLEPEDDPGAQLGAAFSDEFDGWLGRALLPVRLSGHGAPSRLTPWPAPFRSPLYAIAPQPGAPVGSLSSEALAVGADGAIARFEPGQGWLPESLFGAGEKVEKSVQLRSVAWPRPARAYAVGDHGQMWLYRGEIGLWEKDPATPPNLRANLLGVAFDPNDSSRGYAVGTKEVGLGGVLLSYGKTWTEETALPPQVQGAAFTSVAFAGSEAIVAYRRQPNPARAIFEGGLLVNDGSGWRVDEQAATALGPGVPVAVAGLPDGGAAFIAEGGSNGRSVFERQGNGLALAAGGVAGRGRRRLAQPVPRRRRAARDRRRRRRRRLDDPADPSDRVPAASLRTDRIGGDGDRNGRRASPDPRRLE